MTKKTERPVEPTAACRDCHDPARRVHARGRCNRCWRRAARHEPTAADLDALVATAVAAGKPAWWDAERADSSTFDHPPGAATDAPTTRR